ncbi:MAG: hypothetical protein J7L37_00055 [Thermococcus sp.]|nr:hypothetical protein [Thermococcus sp.]
MILLLSLVYEKLKTGNISLAVKKEGDKSMLFLVGLLFIGIIFAYIPALLGIFIKPIVGWFLLPPTLLVLYRLDKIVEGD